jgi:hypothetical protein
MIGAQWLNISRSDNRDLWRRCWEGQSDLNVGEGPGRWERLPPMKTKSLKNKVMSYV